MPSSTVCWSTMMMSPSKFHTPPTRMTDRNNNAVKFTSEQRCPKLDDFVRSVYSKFPCDDCGLHQAGLILRWCENCSEAVCDACILDHHPDHPITWYQEAKRSADQKFGDFLQESNRNMKKLNIERTLARRYHRDIKMKVGNDIIAKVKRRSKDCNEMAAVMRGHLDELIRLGDSVLNGQTVCQRRYAGAVSNSVATGLLDRQKAIRSQLNRIIHIVTEIKAGSDLVDLVKSGGGQ